MYLFHNSLQIVAQRYCVGFLFLGRIIIHISSTLKKLYNGLTIH